MLRALSVIGMVCCGQIVFAGAKDHIVFKGLPEYRNADDCEKDLEVAMKKITKLLQTVEQSAVEGRCREFRRLGKSYVWHLKIDDSHSNFRVSEFASQKPTYDQEEKISVDSIQLDRFGELKVVTTQSTRSKKLPYRIAGRISCDEFGKKAIKNGMGSSYSDYLAYECRLIEEGDERSPAIFEIELATIDLAEINP